MEFFDKRCVVHAQYIVCGNLYDTYNIIIYSIYYNYIRKRLSAATAEIVYYNDVPLLFANV